MTRNTSFTRSLLIAVLLLFLSSAVVSAQSSTIPFMTISPGHGPVGSDEFDVSINFGAYQLSSGPVEVRLQVELTEPQRGLLIVRNSNWDTVMLTCGSGQFDPCYLDATETMDAGDEVRLTLDYTISDVTYGAQRIGSYNFFVNDEPLVTNVPIYFVGRGSTFLPMINFWETN